MDHESGKSRSDWRAVSLCLLHVAILFVPIAFCLLLLAGVSIQKSATGRLDPIETGSVRHR